MRGPESELNIGLDLQDERASANGYTMVFMRQAYPNMALMTYDDEHHQGAHHVLLCKMVAGIVTDILGLEDDPTFDGTRKGILDPKSLSFEERAKLIKEGSYDFALDDQESEEDVLEEIPEELRETEEDRELDRKEAEALKKFDKVTNWLWLGILVGVIGAIVYFFFIR